MPSAKDRAMVQSKQRSFSMSIGKVVVVVVVMADFSFF